MGHISGRYAIVGIGETKSVSDRRRTRIRFISNASRLALTMPGSKPLKVDGFITNQPLNDAHRSYAVRMPNVARISPTYATDLALGGATPIGMVQNAVMAIDAGMANTVMCVHARKRATPGPSPGNPIRHGDEHWEEPWGHFGRRQSRLCRGAPHARIRHHQRRFRPCRGSDAQARLSQRKRNHAKSDDGRRSPGVTLDR